MFRVEKPGTSRFRSSKQQSGTSKHLPFSHSEPPSALVPKPKQHALTPEQSEDVLRMFDLNPRYGPFIGIDRIERWNRAQRFGLDPPTDVRQLLDRGIAIPQRESCSLW